MDSPGPAFSPPPPKPPKILDLYQSERDEVLAAVRANKEAIDANKKILDTITGAPAADRAPYEAARKLASRLVTVYQDFIENNVQHLVPDLLGTTSRFTSGTPVVSTFKQGGRERVKVAFNGRPTLTLTLSGTVANPYWLFDGAPVAQKPGFHVFVLTNNWGWKFDAPTAAAWVLQIPFITPHGKKWAVFSEQIDKRKKTRVQWVHNDPEIPFDLACRLLITYKDAKKILKKAAKAQDPAIGNSTTLSVYIDFKKARVAHVSAGLHCERNDPSSTVTNHRRFNIKYFGENGTFSEICSNSYWQLFIVTM